MHWRYSGVYALISKAGETAGRKCGDHTRDALFWTISECACLSHARGLDRFRVMLDNLAFRLVCEAGGGILRIGGATAVSINLLCSRTSARGGVLRNSSLVGQMSCIGPVDYVIVMVLEMWFTSSEVSRCARIT